MQVTRPRRARIFIFCVIDVDVPLQDAFVRATRNNRDNPKAGIESDDDVSTLVEASAAEARPNSNNEGSMASTIRYYFCH